MIPRMVSSARSRLARESTGGEGRANKENGAGSAATDSLLPGRRSSMPGLGLRFRNTGLGDGEGSATSRPSKGGEQKAVSARGPFQLRGGARLLRSRSSQGSRDAENAALPKGVSSGSLHCPSGPPPPQAAAPVLGDVTSAFANVACTAPPDDTAKEPALKMAAVAVPRASAGVGHGEVRRRAPSMVKPAPCLPEVQEEPERASLFASSASRPRPVCTSLLTALEELSDDPQEVREYAPDIYRLLLRIEGAHQASATYMDAQKHVNLEMRAILVDWLVDVHKKYKCKPQTLFLAVAILDRYLEKQLVQRKCLQLVGVAAMLVAAKYEEQFPPQVRDFVQVTDRTYNKDEICRMEVAVLNTLDFRLAQPTAYEFMERFAKVNGCTDDQRHLAHYLLEHTMVRPFFLKYSASRLAAAAVLVSSRLMHKDPAWTQAAVGSSGIVEAELVDCAQGMVSLLAVTEAGGGKLQAVRKKFSDAKFGQVGKSRWTPDVSAAASQAPPATPATPVVGAESEGGAHAAPQPRRTTTPKLIGPGASASALAGSARLGPPTTCALRPRDAEAPTAVRLRA